MVLGISLGAVGFFVSTALTYRLVLAWPEPESFAGSMAQYLVARMAGMLVVAPSLAYAAGLLFDGGRIFLAPGMVLTMQGIPAALQLAGEGAASLASPLDVVMLVLPAVAGVSLSVLAMGRAQRRARARRDAKAAPERNASPIDFEEGGAGEPKAEEGKGTSGLPENVAHG